MPGWTQRPIQHCRITAPTAMQTFTENGWPAGMPGLLRTGASADLPDAIAARIAANTDLQRLITPAEVAALVVTLLAPTASSVTGQTIRADGTG